jgi:hypothetical protein
MKDDSIVFFQYVRRSDVARYIAAGWVICQLGTPCHHDDYSVIMEWDQLGEPPAMDAGAICDYLESAGNDWPSED